MTFLQLPIISQIPYFNHERRHFIILLHSLEVSPDWEHSGHSIIHVWVKLEGVTMILTYDQKFLMKKIIEIVFMLNECLILWVPSLSLLRDKTNTHIHTQEWSIWYHNVIFVFACDFGNQKCSVNLHSRIPGLHILAGFQSADSIHGFFKHTALFDCHATHGVLVSCCIGQSLLPQFLHTITWLSKESTSTSWALSPGSFWTLLCSGREGEGGSSCMEVSVFPKRAIWSQVYLHTHARAPGKNSRLGVSVKAVGVYFNLLKHPEGLKSVHKNGAADDFILKSCEIYELMSLEMKWEETKMASRILQ